tara:strand:- start:127978 stop:128109 length:132 start_codon:yes stop_codon:yes gene_type:complete
MRSRGGDACLFWHSKLTYWNSFAILPLFVNRRDGDDPKQYLII